MVFAVVRHDDELRLIAHLPDQPCKPPYVGLIQRRVHFVENAERAWLVPENRNQQRQRRHSLLAAA